jgi:S-adenosyl methyltransferase
MTTIRSITRPVTGSPPSYRASLNSLVPLGRSWSAPSGKAYSIVNRLLDPMPSGSYLTLYDPTTDGVHGEAMFEACRRWNDGGGIPPVAVRSSQEIARFFDRVEILEPGVVPVSFWRPDPSHVGTPVEVNTFGGVGRKP